MAEETAAETAIRLYVGGLGERVTEEDIRKTFSNLGSVQSVDILRTKGRSFAYINFLPSSHKSLPKLFSTYNGCAWKGGKLKLEKAKEHYVDRLKREWAEDAELINNEHVNNVDVDENMVISRDLKSNPDLESMQFRLFFPKLRKVKSLPFRGTGKHKYSFQRLQVPSRPVHFCDCPEHSDPAQIYKVTQGVASHLQNSGINEEENNMMSSVMNRLLQRETRSESELVQPHRETQLHDSEIQDGGMNEEEINLMNSVMKKLLDRETSKTERKEHASPQQTIPTADIQEEINEIEDETDDDDIKINAVAGQNFGSFSSEIWELQTSLMAKSNEQRNDDDLARQSKPGVQKTKVKPSSIKKRKPVPNESNEKDISCSIHEKKARLQTQSKESEEHTPLKSVIEPETKKSSTNFGRSQKSAWKQLVGDGGSSSFTLSQITPGAEANSKEHHKLGEGTSPYVKEYKNVHSFVHEKPKPRDEAPAESKEYESVKNVVQENFRGQSPQSNAVHEKPKPGDETLAESKEHELVNNAAQEGFIGQSSQPNEIEGPPTVQPSGPAAASDKAIKGSSWLQKSSWMKLVGGENTSSFSISQILPGDLLEKQHSNKSNGFSNMSSVSSGTIVKEHIASETASGGFRRSGSTWGVPSKKEIATRGKASSSNDPPDSASNQKSDSEPKQTSSTLPGVRVSESCPFTRNADSLKEWMTAKTALGNSLKKRNNNK